MTINDETALRIGRELARLSGQDLSPEQDRKEVEPAVAISLGRIAVKLCTPVVLEMIREPTWDMAIAGVEAYAADMAEDEPYAGSGIGMQQAFRAMIDKLREQ